MGEVSHAPNDNAKRSFAKAISWRIVGTLDTFILSMVVIYLISPIFGDIGMESGGDIAKAAGAIAITEVFTKIIIYFLHERGWSKVGWGLKERNGEIIESRHRSVYKTATWRVLASLDTMIIAWFFTGSIGTAFTIGSLEVVTKLFLYYFHERAWTQVSWRG